MIALTIQSDGTKTELVASRTADITVNQHPDIPVIDLLFKTEAGEEILISFDKQLLIEV